jgi:hypothetical protein
VQRKDAQVDSVQWQTRLAPAHAQAVRQVSQPWVLIASLEQPMSDLIISFMHVGSSPVYWRSFSSLGSFMLGIIFRKPLAKNTLMSSVALI